MTNLREPEHWPEMPDKFYEALGWMHAECCAAFDRGEDPGMLEVGEMVQRCIRDLTRDSEETMTDEKENDYAAVDRFAEAMKAKLNKARARGHRGWHDPSLCSGEDLAALLIDHLQKDNVGTFEDVANFCMMLHQRNEPPSTLCNAFNNAARRYVAEFLEEKSDDQLRE